MAAQAAPDVAPAAAPATDVAAAVPSATAAATTAAVDVVTVQTAALAVSGVKPATLLTASPAFVDLLTVEVSDLKITQANPESPLYSAVSFKELAVPGPGRQPIPPALLTSLRDVLFYDKPSSIQEKALPLLLKNPPENMIFQSQAGTGKTAAFLIAALSRVDPTLAHPQVVITAPTKMLADQVYQVTDKMATGTGITTKLFTGGSEMPPLITQHVLCLTPGALMKAIGKTKKHFDPDRLRVWVVDEADLMFHPDMPFGADLKAAHKVFRHPEQLQIVLLSATFKGDVLKLVSWLMPTVPNTIRLPAKCVTLPNVKQFFVQLKGEAEKDHFVGFLYDSVTIGTSIVFCDAIANAERLARKMVDLGYKVSLLHGKLQDHDQFAALINFREGKTSMLITTDILSRGIDLPKVSMVLQYDVPMTKPARGSSEAAVPDFITYYHRCGRTGRFGKTGSAIVMVDTTKVDDLEKLKFIKDKLGHDIKPIAFSTKTTADAQASAMELRHKAEEKSVTSAAAP